MRNIHSKRDILDEKRRELNSYVARFNGAVSLITSTVENLNSINAAIEDKIAEIDSYQDGLADTKAGLLNAREKNSRVISNLHTLLGEDAGGING